MREILEIIIGIWFFIGMCIGLSTMNKHKNLNKILWVITCMLYCPFIIIYHYKQSKNDN